MYSRKHIKERKNITRKKKYGGKTIESGGYGCIFQPPLKCKNIQNQSSHNKTRNVTKLMIKKYAKREFREIRKYQHLLRNIPNYENYFLINDFNTCFPEKLSKQDLTDFNENCRALVKHNYNEKNVNDKMNELAGINMPYGGVDISEYIYRIHFNIEQMKILNEKLIQLLKGGIVIMNEKGVYHGDIKESNVLVGEENNTIYTRLIDWGLSGIYHNEDKLPEIFTERPFQYNIPFSSILLNRYFIDACEHFLKKKPDPSRSEIRSFTVNYVLHLVKQQKSNHLKFINKIFQMLFKHELYNINDSYSNEIMEYNYTYENIYDYISKILERFIKNGKFHVKDYFKQVYIKNLDIWGFVTIYIYFIEYISIQNKKHHIDHYKKNQLKLLDKIKEAYVLLLNSADKPVDINVLVKILNEIDPLLNKSLREEFKKKKTNVISLLHFLGNRVNDMNNTSISRVTLHDKTSRNTRNTGNTRNTRNAKKK